MIGRLVKDWKFFATLAVSIAGILVPVWLTMFGQRGKALSVHLLSQSSLKPSSQEVIPGLQITVEGVPLENPFLTVLQLINNGSKSITTKDFESPLEIRTNPSSSIIRARVSAKSPDDINAEIEADKESIRVKPTLLNPNDSITIAILSSGEQPQFIPKARIVGIHAVPLRDAMKDAPRPFKKWFLLFGAFIGAVSFITMLGRVSDFSKNQTGVALRRRTAMVITLFLGVLSEILAIESFNIIGFWQAMLAVSTIFIISIPFAWQFEYRKNKLGINGVSLV